MSLRATSALQEASDGKAALLGRCDILQTALNDEEHGSLLLGDDSANSTVRSTRQEATSKFRFSIV